MNGKAALAPFLALGDSYTIGEGVRREDSWPCQLAVALRGEGYPIQDPEVLAKTGWTTGDLETALSARDRAGTYALVTLQIGVNDQYQGVPLAVFATRYRSLLAQAVELAGDLPDRVLAVSIPDWSVTPFAASRQRAKISEEIQRFNLRMRTLTQAQQVRFIDITPHSRKAEKEPALLAGDGLHPSARMYREWIQVIHPQARATFF